MSVCEAQHVELYARFRSEREDWIQAMVLARIGFAFMPEYSVTLAGLLVRPLLEPEVRRDVVLATRTEDLAHPFTFHRTRMRTRLAADNNPMNAAQVDPG